ncbi:MAG: hypothetical protein QMD65_00165 [Patescibacteria group bacterium]|nr:hypothetical protein [Patescibacteria group bacterium]
MKKTKLRSRVISWSKSLIRQVLKDLRDNNVIEGYKEGKVEARLIEFILKIRKDKPRLKIEFIEPVKDWRHRESAYHGQIFLKEVPDFKDLTETILREINARKKGWQHEDMVFATAKNMIGNSPVRDVWLSTKNQDRYDGIDLNILFISKEEQKEIPIQVKSSFEGLKEHARQFGHKIPALIVNEKDTEFTIKNKIIRIAEAYCRGIILQF